LTSGFTVREGKVAHKPAVQVEGLVTPRGLLMIVLRWQYSRTRRWLVNEVAEAGCCAGGVFVQPTGALDSRVSDADVEKSRDLKVDPTERTERLSRWRHS
jgi:hypothetical protein